MMCGCVRQPLQHDPCVLCGCRVVARGGTLQRAIRCMPSTAPTPLVQHAAVQECRARVLLYESFVQWCRTTLSYKGRTSLSKT